MFMKSYYIKANPKINGTNFFRHRMVQKSEKEREREILAARVRERTEIK